MTTYDIKQRLISVADPRLRSWLILRQDKVASVIGTARPAPAPAPARSSAPAPSRSSSSSASEEFATYKGKTYKLLYVGKTKFGHKAKLAFLDGSKEFWVASSDISRGGSSGGSGRSSTTRRAPSGRYECPECGEYVTRGSQCWETGARH